MVLFSCTWQHRRRCWVADSDLRLGPCGTSCPATEDMAGKAALSVCPKSQRANDILFQFQCMVVFTICGDVQRLSRLF